MRKISPPAFPMLATIILLPNHLLMSHLLFLSANLLANPPDGLSLYPPLQPAEPGMVVVLTHQFSPPFPTVMRKSPALSVSLKLLAPSNTTKALSLISKQIPPTPQGR